MALSRAARIFNKTPTVENFKKLAHAQPAEAATWISALARNEDLPAKLVDGLRDVRWSSTLSDPEKLEKMEKLLGTHQATIAKVIKTAIETDELSPVDLGWTTAPAEQQVVQGRLGMANGYLTLKTSKGTVAIVEDEYASLKTRDISTLLGSTVSIRGYLENKSSGGKTLMALEWTPGQHHDFVSGRVERDGDKIGIRVNADKFVEVTNREFKALLKSWEEAGLSFAGTVKQVGKRWVFEGRQPKEVHLLVSLGKPSADGKGPYVNAITPSPSTTMTPTTITGPRVDTRGYVRRFIAGRIVPAKGANDADTDYPPRAFEMTKAWKAIDGKTERADESGLVFSPVPDRAGEL